MDRYHIHVWYTVLPSVLQKPNSWTYNFFEVSGHNLKSSQTWGFCKDFLNYRETVRGGVSMKNYKYQGQAVEVTLNSKEENSWKIQKISCLNIEYVGVLYFYNLDAGRTILRIKNPLKNLEFLCYDAFSILILWVVRQFLYIWLCT